MLTRRISQNFTQCKIPNRDTVNHILPGNIKYNKILPCSVPIERKFSKKKAILALRKKKKTRMSHDHIEKAMYLKSNRSYL